MSDGALATVLPFRRPADASAAQEKEHARALDEAFARVARALPGFTPRPGQRTFALAAGEALRNGGHLLAEAPCGTGKSLGYGVPAVLHVQRTGKRVVITTANIALQEQLVTKDLPLLQKALGGFRFALLKGRSNYACQHLVANPDEAEGIPTLDEETELRQVDRWAARTLTGDRAELPFVVSDGAWGFRSMDRDGCLRDGCAFHESCFASHARQRAEEAQVLVVNDHLLAAHLAVHMETGADVVIPTWDALVVDEAHELGDIARDFFGHTLGEGRVGRVRKFLTRRGRNRMPCEDDRGHATRVEAQRVAAERLDGASREFFDALAQLMAGRKDALRLTAPDVLPSGLADALAVAAFLAERVALPLNRLAEDGVELSRDNRRLRSEATTAARRARIAVDWLRAAADPVSDPEHVHWVTRQESRRGARVSLESRPLEAGPILAWEVWDRTRAVIATSATLTTGEGVGGWGWIRRQLGAPTQARVLAVDSPFDLRTRARLWIPPTMPDPQESREAFDRAVVKILRDVVMAAGGRTLGLFTSRRMVALAKEALAGVPYLVLAQGDDARTRLVERFRREPASVLLGTASLWTGVDVQGESCVAVVLDKLPFASPADPMEEAVHARWKARTGDGWAAFREEQLPRATLRLRQGAGRLIRSGSDWGVVVLCDARLHHKRYGAGVIRALGLTTRAEDWAEVEAFLRAGRAGVDLAEEGGGRHA